MLVHASILLEKRVKTTFFPFYAVNIHREIPYNRDMFIQKEFVMDRIYLITGAAGFLGSNICRILISSGKRVRALVLPGDKSTKYIPNEVEIVNGDLCDIPSLDRFFTLHDGMESVVIHAASIVTVSEEFNQKVMDVNVGGTKNIINQCLKHKECKKLVYVSSTGAIPELPKGNLIKEVSTFNPEENQDKVRGCYSQSKALASKAILDAVLEKGLDATIVHPSGILGPDDYALGETTRTLIKIIKGEMPAGIDGSFNLCDVRDLAKACISAVDNGRKGECYILGNEEIRFKDFARLVAKAAGCKPPMIFLPGSIANLMADIMTRKAKKRGEKPMMTRFSVYNLMRNNSFDSSKARKELGYTTRSYEETMFDEINWLKSVSLI